MPLDNYNDATEDYDDEPEDEDDRWEFDCGRDREGFCGKAGSEECDFECPYRDGLSFMCGSQVYNSLTKVQGVNSFWLDSRLADLEVRSPGGSGRRGCATASWRPVQISDDFA